jgi:hypothetical protein
MIPIVSWSLDEDRGLVTALNTSTSSLPIACWGCEVGNWFSMFSHHDMGGMGCEVLNKNITCSETLLQTSVEFQLVDGIFRINSEDRLCDGAVWRTYTLEPLEESMLGDFVMRHVASTCNCPDVMLSGQLLHHAGKNRMVTAPASSIELLGSGIHLQSQLLEMDSPSGFDRMSYARDEPPNLWILHHRFIANKHDADAYVLRIRHWIRRFEPRGLGKLLCASPLFRFSERHGWMRPTVQSTALRRVRPGDTLKIRTKIFFVREKYSC